MQRWVGMGVAQASRKNEDTVSVLEARIGKKAEHVFLLLVADGHSGQFAAAQVRDRMLPGIVASAEDGSNSALKTACQAQFQQIHKLVHARQLSCMSFSLDLVSFGREPSACRDRFLISLL